jgi:surface polysaccharide O-acyltransferase-like enzyme
MRWIAAALAGFVLWTTLTALAMQAEGLLLPLLNVAAALGFVLASTSACFALAAVFSRYCTGHSPLLAVFSDHAYGIYFFHYGFVLWLQYMLLDLPLIAPAKAAIVITGALLLSWAASAITVRIVRRQAHVKSRPRPATLS